MLRIKQDSTIERQRQKNMVVLGLGKLSHNTNPDGRRMQDTNILT